MFTERPHPKLPEADRRSRCFTMAMTASEADELDRIAKASARSKAEVVRAALRGYLGAVEREGHDGNRVE